MRKFLVLLVFAWALTISACDGEDRLDFTAAIVRTDVFSWNFQDERPLYPVIIRSMDELEEYMAFYEGHVLWHARLPDGGLANTYMNDVVFGGRDETFFDDKFMVILYFEEGSGSISHSVDAVLENGDIRVTRFVPEAGTGDMAGWHIVVRIDNSIVPEQFRAVVENRRE